MFKKRLSVSLILFLILTLVVPFASFADSISSEKQVVSKLGDVQYEFSDGAIQNLVLNRNGQALGDFAGEAGTSSTLEIFGSVAPQNYVPESDSNEVISVIVELQAEPLAVHEAKVAKGQKSGKIDQRSIIAQQQANYKAAAKNKGKSKINKEYSYIFNGFAVEVAANQVEQLLELPGVKAVYPDVVVEAGPIEAVNDWSMQMDRSTPHIGANFMWDQNLTGKGIKVGVLDTGIDYNHPDLKHAYKGGYDFVDNDRDPYETTPGDFAKAPPGTPPVNDRGSTYWTDHGTHVAGIIAGRGAAPGGVKGVAPDAWIYAYRVLGPYGSGSTAGIIAAVEQSVKDGMDIINLSLGASSNNQYSANSVALNNAMLAGVVVVVSAGNSGPNEGTLTDPATSEMAISVANSTPPTKVPMLSTSGLKNITGSMMSFSPELGDLAGQSLEVVFVSYGTEDEFKGKDVAGKIALMERGSISFHDKSVNAQNAGAAVAIVYNNAAGNFNGTLGEPGNYIPTFSLSQAEGQLLRAKFEQEGAFTVQLGYTIEQDFINDTSSRGPAKPGYDMKPDIAAPGTGILSSIPAYGKEDRNADYSTAYDAFTGTSMAAPQIAGSAALLIEKYRGSSLSPFEIKALLMNTAQQISDRDGNRYSHMDQGAGRVDLFSAAAAMAVASVVEATDAVEGGMVTQYETGSLSFGYLKPGASETRTIHVRDIAKKDSAHTISSVWYGDVGGNISTSKDAVQLKTNSRSEFTFTLDVPANTKEGYYQAALLLTEAKGHTLRIPISFYVGEPVQLDPVTNLVLDPDVFSPNGDTIYDTTNITFDLNQTGYISLDVHSWFTGGWYGPLVEAILAPGSYILRNWDAVIDLGATGTAVKLPDNIYLMAPWFAPAGSTDVRPVNSAITPFIVDTKAPVSSVVQELESKENGNGVIHGNISSDQFITLLNQGVLLGSISDYIAVAALYEVGGKWKQVDGVVDNAGNFTIEVPLSAGENTFEIYVYDAAGNGIRLPAHIVQFTLE